MTTANRLDGPAARAWVSRAVQELALAREELNRVNVFPVPDSDTGTNLHLTVLQGAAHVAELPPEAGPVAVVRAFAQGALLGARGNSGVILSEYVRGLAAGLAAAVGTGADGIGAQAVGSALARAARCAYDAVAEPARGTILTAADEAAEAAATAALAGAGLDALLWEAALAARDALVRSPDDLTVLRRAGVRDAGAYGLALVLHALHGAVTGQEDEEAFLEAGLLRASGTAAGASGVVGDGPDHRHALHGAGSLHDALAEDGVDGEFEVMFVVETPRDVGDELRASLLGLGESVVVVGGDGLWQAHVHTDHPERAIDAGALGSLSQVCVRHLPSQTGNARERPADWPGVVAVTSSPALIADLARAGAVVLVARDRAPGRDEVLRAAVDTGAPLVLVLPGDAGLRADQEVRAVQAQPVELRVLPATTDLHVVLGLRAWAQACEESREPEEAVLAVGRALDAARVETVDVAGPEAVGEAVRRVAGAEPGVLTILHGREVDAADLLDRVRGAAPSLEVVPLPSGRDDDVVRLGAE